MLNQTPIVRMTSELPPSTREPGRRGKQGETRARLIQVAIELVRTEGLAALTTSRITRAAGIAQPGFYAHFRNVEEVLQTAVMQVIEEMRENRATRADGPAQAASTRQRPTRPLIEAIEPVAAGRLTIRIAEDTDRRGVAALPPERMYPMDESSPLNALRAADQLVQPALSVGAQAVEVLVGILFTFAVGAYWIFERDRTVDLVASMLPRPKRKKLRDTWTLIDQKLGAFVRGQLILIAFVSVFAAIVLSAIGEPYWLLVAIATGILEIVPVIGPLAALVLAAGVGLTVSWHIALFAAIALLAIRLLEDYFVIPRVLGGAVGLSPLLTIVSVSVTGILLGGFYVLLAIPIASLVATIVDVTVRGVDPAEVDVPTVLFPAQDTS